LLLKKEKKTENQDGTLSRSSLFFSLYLSLLLPSPARVAERRKAAARKQRGGIVHALLSKVKGESQKR